MKLLQRVTTLIRANLNDLVDRAEDPEKMIKQLILDLNNQLIQVKTTVAQSLADQHLLEKRLVRAREEAASSGKRAELAVDKGDESLARAALERQNSFERTIADTEQHLDEQRKETEALKVALSQLELKIGEVTRQRDVLLARHRRAVAKTKLSHVKSQVHPEKLEELLNAIGGYVDRAEAHAQATSELQNEHEQRKLAAMESEDKISRQLEALKARRKKTADAAA